MEGSWKGGCVLLVVCGGSRLQVHPPQQVLEARVVAEGLRAMCPPIEMVLRVGENYGG